MPWIHGALRSSTILSSSFCVYSWPAWKSQIDELKHSTQWNGQRIAYAFAVGDDEGLVVGDHALGHAPPVPLAGTGVVGQ